MYYVLSDTNNIVVSVTMSMTACIFMLIAIFNILYMIYQSTDAVQQGRPALYPSLKAHSSYLPTLLFPKRTMPYCLTESELTTREWLERVSISIKARSHVCYFPYLMQAGYQFRLASQLSVATRSQLARAMSTVAVADPADRDAARCFHDAEMG